MARKQKPTLAAQRRQIVRTRRQRKRRGAFTQLPEYLPEATEFSDDPDFGDPVWLLKTLRHYPDIFDQLEAATDLAKHYGRPRCPGNWWMIMFAFVCSGEVDIQTFHKRYSSSAIWQLAGFLKTPGPTTCWYRMTELEPLADEFTAAANKLIARAMKHEPRIGRWVWFDGTGFETHARLEHCCTDKEACKAAGGRPPRFVDQAGSEVIKTERHAESAEMVLEDPEERGVLKEVHWAQSPRQRPRSRRQRYRYFEYGPPGKRHLYRTLDPDATARKYGGPGRKERFWLGGNACAAASMFVGAPLAVDARVPAGTQEYDAFRPLLDAAMQATGARPEAITADRAYSYSGVFEHTTQLGIGAVIPWRKWHPKMEKEDVDCDLYDRHGVVRCKYCGGACDQMDDGLGLYFDGRNQPRLRVRCNLGLTPECKTRKQSIACKEEWRMLNPLSRRSETYHALKRSGKSQEHIFRHWRDRYSVAGNDIDNRPKRPGLAWQHLRAQIALAIEWLQLGLRHGWIGSHRRRNTATVQKMRPGKHLQRTEAARRLHDLDLPMGKYAHAAGYGGGGGPPP